jgi:hypothetical protein
MSAKQPAGRGGIALGLDTLDLSLQYLMTRYARKPDPEVARAVTDHLEMLMAHPEVADNLTYRELYNRLLATWRPLGDAADGPRRRWWRRMGIPMARS